MNNEITAIDILKNADDRDLMDTVNDLLSAKLYTMSDFEYELKCIDSKTCILYWFLR